MEAIEECGACSCTEDGDVVDSHEGDTMQWGEEEMGGGDGVGLRHNVTE